MKVLTIAWANLLRTTRDRTNLFFVFLLPIIIIVVLGLTFGGARSIRFGVADADGGTLARELVASIDTGDLPLQVRTYGSVDELRDAVSRGFVALGLSIPADYDATLTSGGTATAEVVAQPGTQATALRTAIDEAIGRQAALVSAARFAAAQNGVPFGVALEAARAQQAHVAGVTVAQEAIGSSTFDPSLSGYTLGAQSQLVLFMFLTSLTAAAQLILSRQLGVSRRMFSTPTSARTIILGEALGRLAVALGQGLFIFAASALLFGVDWGDPVASTALVVSFALVGTGAAMLLGSLARTQEQAGSVGPTVALLMALLGGSMVPPEIFPPVMQTLSHLTPHAWAIEGFREIVVRGGGILDVVPDLAVLLAVAAVLLLVSSLRLRRAITG